MSEWLMIFIMVWCSSLFAIGGTKGKYWRRLVLPLGLAGIALFSHVLWYKAVLMAISLIVSLSMGYGERDPYINKFMVFCLYGMSFLWIGWSWWVVLTPILCISLFALSNWKPTAKMFFWKYVEFSYGLLLAVTFISTIRR